ncbi:hypothetical protein HQ585_11715 [candidate division KSB1 bacterium]|nr:hypothetical protein [candidate division KSB1 bacterium]
MSNVYKWITIFILASGIVQAQNASLISQQPYVKLNLSYQSWQSEAIINSSEIVTPLSIYYPMNRQTAFMLRSSQGSFKGDGLSNLSGLGDTQLTALYHLIDSNILFQLGVNLPTGQSPLTWEQFQSSIQLGQIHYGYRLPHFGQGLNISPGVSWAKPINEQTVLGLGAAFQLSGSYQPLADFDQKYNPGNEILLTGGVDYQFDKITALSFDLILSFYGTDEYDTTEVYKSGNKIVATLQFQKYFGVKHLHLMARFRSRTKSQSVSGGILVQDEEKTYPDQLQALARYTLRMNPKTRIVLIGEAQYFFNMIEMESLSLIGIGVSPRYQVSPKAILTGRLKLNTGFFKGYSKTMGGVEVAAGMEYFF